MKIYRILLLAFIAFSFTLCVFAAQKLEGRNHPLTAEEQSLMKQAKVSIDEAKKIALHKAPGKIFNWELENEDNRVIYSIQIQLPNDKKYSREVNVDANTGKIVGIEKENLSTQLKDAEAGD